MALRCFRVIPRSPERTRMIEEAPVDCLSCGQSFTLSIDTTGGREQSYVEDCPVCCRPMEIRVRIFDGVPSVEVGTEDDPGF